MSDSEWEEVRLSLRSSFLDQLKQWVSINHLMGTLYPEGDAAQKLALIVLMETGRIPKPKKKKGE